MWKEFLKRYIGYIIFKNEDFFNKSFNMIMKLIDNHTNYYQKRAQYRNLAKENRYKKYNFIERMVDKFEYHSFKFLCLANGYKSPEKESYIFRSFFDKSMGIDINSPFQKREIEKKYGVKYLSLAEKEAAEKEAKSHLKNKRIQKIRKDLTPLIEDKLYGK